MTMKLMDLWEVNDYLQYGEYIEKQFYTNAPYEVVLNYAIMLGIPKKKGSEELIDALEGAGYKAEETVAVDYYLSSNDLVEHEQWLRDNHPESLEEILEGTYDETKEYKFDWENRQIYKGVKQ